MAFDPYSEDYQRLGLRYAHSLHADDPFSAARAFSSFDRRFRQDRNSLPQQDDDRAFHLVGEATDLIDYRLPFSTATTGPKLLSEAHHLLDEAIDLNPTCYDAIRMKAAAEVQGFEAYYQFLSSRAEEVRIHCEAARQVASDFTHGSQRALAVDIAMRPYVRWMATLASKALICGHYRKTLSIVHDVLAIDPADNADVRRTAALALAKLEDEEGLERLAALPSFHGIEDGWLIMGRLALAHRSRDLKRASRVVHRCIKTYPRAAATLARQDELPDGVYARLAVAPMSEDELILAVSEATVLLDEGRDVSDMGSLGGWLINQSEIVEAAEEAISSLGTSGSPGGRA